MTSPNTCYQDSSYNFDDFVGIKSYKIAFKAVENPTRIFEFSPVAAYNVLEYNNPLNPLNLIVIIFRLKMTMILEQASIETIIPYYMSDGSTNDLRANLLLPFSCFNEQDLKSLSSPYSLSYIRNTIWKYAIGKNMNFNLPIPPYYQNIQNKKVGLISVLERIENCLDFVIALVSSDKINQPQIMFNLPSFRPFKFSRKTRWNYNFDAIPIKGDNDEQTKNDDSFRSDILNFLLPYKNNIENRDNTDFEITPCYVILKDIGIVEFNTIYGVCRGTYPEIKEKKNFENYKIISHQFFKDLKVSKHKTFFNSIFSLSPTYSSHADAKEHLFTGFNAICLTEDKSDDTSPLVEGKSDDTSPLVEGESDDTSLLVEAKSETDDVPLKRKREN
jgi:hypothetical protein